MSINDYDSHRNDNPYRNKSGDCVHGILIRTESVLVISTILMPQKSAINHTEQARATTITDNKAITTESKYLPVMTQAACYAAKSAWSALTHAWYDDICKDLYRKFDISSILHRIKDKG